MNGSMRRMRALAVVSVFCLGACAQDSTVALRFTAIPDDNTSELKRKFEPLAEYLASALGVEVQYIPSSDYGASVEMFKNGDVQLAWFGGLTGAQARQAVPGAHAIAQGEEDRAYYSYFIVNASTGLQPTDAFPLALADLTFTFGSPQSTSGRLMPEYFLRQATGKSPREFFDRPYSFSGSHAQTLALVATGSFEAGAVNYRSYEAEVASGKIDPSRVRVIWKTPAFADYNFTAHPSLETRFGEGFTERLRTALIALDDPEILTALRRSKLVRAEDGDYEELSTIARSLELLR